MNFWRGPLLIPDSKNMFSSRQYLFTFSGQRYVLQKIIAYECVMQNSIIIVNKGKNNLFKSILLQIHNVIS